MRPRIQAGDRLHQHFASPNGGDKWFPMYHCTALQLDQNSVNKNSLNVQLFQDNKKLTVKKNYKREFSILGIWRNNVNQGTFSIALHIFVIVTRCKRTVYPFV